MNTQSKKVEISVADLIGIPLDWAVATCQGLKTVVIDPRYCQGGKLVFIGQYDWREDAHVEANYSTDWGQGGPIKQQEKIVDGIVPQIVGESLEWFALKHCDTEYCWYGAKSYGPTPLIAAMRCYVVSKLGAKIKVPKELLNASATS